jgi:hypothetical protein
MALILRFGLKEIFISLINLFIILLSVTRTELAIIAGQVASAFVASPGIFMRPASLKKMLGVLMLVSIVIAVDYGSGAGLTDRWISRLTVAHAKGSDPTALTRIAETNFMMDSFSSSFEHTLVGNGLAARTQLTGYEAALAGSLVGMGSVTSVHSIGFGHNNYASILFIGGIVVGGPLLFFTFLSGFHAIALMRKLLKKNTYSEPFVYIGVWGSVITIGMLIQGALGGIYSDRAICLWCGIGAGMLYWSREQVGQKCPSSKLIKAIPETGAGNDD